MLRRCVENVATASAALVSLTKLLEKVKNMVIADHIQTLTATAVESIDKVNHWGGSDWVFNFFEVVCE